MVMMRNKGYIFLKKPFLSSIIYGFKYVVITIHRDKISTLCLRFPLSYIARYR
jgi:hypothetical protein